jgi:hypothetical protein
MVPGLYGPQEGMLSRFSKSLSNPGYLEATAGFVLWSPDYACVPDDSHPGPHIYGASNVIIFSTTHPGNSPVNTVAVPAYSHDGNSTPFDPAVAIGGSSFADPAGEFLLGTTAMDARNLASCLSLTYTGTMTESAGQVAFLENIPNTLMVRGGTSGGPPTVDQLFNYSTKKMRLGTDTMQIVSRTAENSDTFRIGTMSPIRVGDELVNATDIFVDGTIQQPEWFGFAWRGLPTNAAQPMYFDFIKMLEWRPQAVIGLTHAPPVTINPTRMDVKATQHLDVHAPGWSTTVVDGVATVVGKLSQAAITGVTAGIAATTPTQRIALGSTVLGML